MAFKHQTDQLPPSIASKFLEQICFRNSLFMHNLKVCEGFFVYYVRWQEM